MMTLTPVEIEAVLLSLRVSAVAVACALPFAIVIGAVLAHVHFPGKFVLDAVVHLPLILPPVVMGYLLLISLGTRGPIGAWLLDAFGVRLMFSWTGAAVASAIVTFPFQVRTIRLALEHIDLEIYRVAQTLGAGRLDRFLSLTLPLGMRGIVAGAITAFVSSLGQFGAIITFVSNIPGETRTLPLAIYTLLQTPGGERAAARLAAFSIGLGLSGLLLANFAISRMKTH